MAWSAVVPTLARFEVLEIFLKPEAPKGAPSIAVNDGSALDLDSLPNYEDVKEKSGGADFLSPSRAPSPYMKQLSLDEVRRASEPRSSSSSCCCTRLPLPLFRERTIGLYGSGTRCCCARSSRNVGA